MFQRQYDNVTTIIFKMARYYFLKQALNFHIFYQQCNKHVPQQEILFLDKKSVNVNQSKKYVIIFELRSTIIGPDYVKLTKNVWCIAN